MRHPIISLLIAAAGCIPVTRPLHAQAPDPVPADTSLAGAVATLLAYEIILEQPQPRTVTWDYAGTPMDSAVARRLFRDERVRVRTEGLVFSPSLTVYNHVVEGDSARVTIVLRHQHSFSALLNFYENTSIYLFRRASGGWRLVRLLQRAHADGGVVRG